MQLCEGWWELCMRTYSIQLGRACSSGVVCEKQTGSRCDKSPKILGVMSRRRSSFKRHFKYHFSH